MKYVIIIPDGAADMPIEELDGKTPLEAAAIDNINSLANNGRLGLVRTVSEGLHPGSDVAIMSVLGYDPLKYYTGRAPLEAAAMNIKMSDDEIAFRCNLVTIIDGIMEDFSAGHIKTSEACELINLLNNNLQSEGVRFFSGVSYRHLMLSSEAERFKKLRTTPPHDIIGQKIEKYLPAGSGSDFIISLMKKSQEIFADCEINQVRADLGENPATSIWLWGQGQRPRIKPFREIYGLDGAVITAVDLVRGLGRLIGWQIIDVEGATGYIDTNYAGKAQAAIETLDSVDIVAIHIEAPDEAGHNGDYESKIYALEQIDRYIVLPVKEKLESLGDWRMLILPDHPTPVALKTHTADFVPFLIAGNDIAPNGANSFSENQANKVGLKIDIGWQLMEYFLK